MSFSGTSDAEAEEAAETLLAKIDWNVEQAVECFCIMLVEKEHGIGR